MNMFAGFGGFGVDISKSISELNKMIDKMDHKTFFKIQSFLEELADLLENENNPEYWSNKEYLTFENYLKNLSRKDEELLIRLLDETIDVKFKKSQLGKEFKKLKKKNKSKIAVKKKSNPIKEDFDPFDELDNSTFNHSNNTSRIRRNKLFGSFNFSGLFSKPKKVHYKGFITFLDLKDDDYMNLGLIDLNGKDELKDFLKIIEKFKSRNPNYNEITKLEKEFLEKINNLPNNHIKDLEYAYKKNFNKKVLINSFYEYLNTLSYNFANNETSEKENAKEDIFEFSENDIKDNSETEIFGFSTSKKETNSKANYFSLSPGYNKTKQPSSAFQISNAEKKENIVQNIKTKSIIAANNETSEKETDSKANYFSLSPGYNKMQQPSSAFQISNAEKKENITQNNETKSIIAANNETSEKETNSKANYFIVSPGYDKMQQPSSAFQISNTEKKENITQNLETCSIIAPKYVSIISFIETITNISILTEYKETLDNLFEKLFIDSGNSKLYIEKSNLLIDETLTSLNLNYDEICSLVKYNYDLVLDSNKSSKDIINQLIGDELRYYQQSKLPVNKNYDNISNSRIIQKCFVPTVDDKMLFSYGIIRSDNQTFYRLDEKLFEKCKFSMNFSDYENLNKTNVEALIRNGLFSGELSDLELHNNGRGNFDISNEDLLADYYKAK